MDYNRKINKIVTRNFSSQKEKIIEVESNVLVIFEKNQKQTFLSLRMTNFKNNTSNNLERNKAILCLLTNNERFIVMLLFFSVACIDQHHITKSINKSHFI